MYWSLKALDECFHRGVMMVTLQVQEVAALAHLGQVLLILVQVGVVQTPRVVEVPLVGLVTQ